MTSRGRLLSPIGCLGALLLSVVIVIIVLLSGGTIFSPGALTAQADNGTPLKGFDSHAAFESDCRMCHAPFGGIRPERCEACHKDVGAERASGTGLHGKIEAGEAARCETCHLDHRGRGFDTDTIALRTFDHSSTGFSLARHIVNYEDAPVTCRDCHTGATGSFELTACTSCHAAQDAAFTKGHLQAFGPQCLSCHDGAEETHGFDHANTDFALDGNHADRACADCHSPAVPAAEAPTECAGCHEEPAAHAGVFSADCATCHSTASWSPARLDDGTQFQHAVTGFQLEFHIHNYDGSPFNCRTCHTGSQFEVIAQTCTDCHGEHDVEFMTQHLADYGPNCVSCHDGAGNLQDFDHDSVFPLDGQHAPLGCDACHADQQFNTAPRECSGCHADPEVHVGLFGANCVACHTASAWTPAQLTQHTFPLDHGGQGEITCATCHANTYVTYTCYGCHEHDPEDTRRVHARLDITGDRLNDCAACHATGRMTTEED